MPSTDQRELVADLITYHEEMASEASCDLGAHHQEGGGVSSTLRGRLQFHTDAVEYLRKLHLLLTQA